MQAAPAMSLDCHVSASFTEWLASGAHSLAISTYQANKVVFVSWDGQQVSVLPRHFDKPMGLHLHGQRLALATRHEVILLANAPLLAPDFFHDQPGRYDALFLPRMSFMTGDLNIHDLAFGKEGLWLVNTRFGCLAHPSMDYSFVPRWKPPFLSELAPEDRCHLNGLAMIEGEPRYVTALGETNTVGGWRPGKASGGVLMEVPSGAVALRGLSMPHSPRWHQGKLYLLNSGAGELLRYDPATRTADVVCTLPGYLRGLSLAGRYALVGLSQIRERHIFGDLPVQSRFERLHCGVWLLDLETGQEVGRLEFTSGCTELFEVQVLPGMRRPMIVNREREESRQAFPAPDFSYWLRPQNEIPTPNAGNP